MTPSTGSAQTLGYDQANRLRSYALGSTTTSYAYNADGLRMSKTNGSTTTQYLWNIAGNLPLLLKDGSTTYIYGPGGLPLEQISGSTTYYFHHDQIRSTRLLTDSTGTVQATYQFDPYGNLIAVTGTIVNPFRFSGEYQDVEAGLYYLRARYYDPITGLFVSRDPLQASTRQAYSYAVGNPLNTSDPTGLFPSFCSEMQGDLCMSPFSAAAASIAAAAGPHPNCAAIADEIRQYATEVVWRWEMLRDDPLDLRLTDPTRYANHRQAFENSQVKLRRLLAQFQQSGCKGSGCLSSAELGTANAWANLALPAWAPTSSAAPNYNAGNLLTSGAASGAAAGSVWLILWLIGKLGAPACGPAAPLCFVAG